jgi:hypothetical protein
MSVMLSIFLLSVIVLSVFLLSVILLTFILLKEILLLVIMLSAFFAECHLLFYNGVTHIRHLCHKIAI